jgi:galactokinase
MVQLPEDNTLRKLYGNQTIKTQKKRYQELILLFQRKFPGSEKTLFFSTPGRIEIGGNHTDHNRGKILAGAVNLDSIAAVSKNNSNKIIFYSEEYKKPFQVDLNQLEKKKSEEGSTTSLIRGIAYKLKKSGHSLGGFNGYMTSNVMIGSGLSSSASMGVLIGTIFNSLFNQNKIPPLEIAMIGQYAENNYFNKPCGLMDQVTCSVGGIITIDFKNPQKPKVKKIDYNFNSCGYSVLIINTGGSHANLTDDYAAVQSEMKKVARKLGGEVLRDISQKDLLKNLSRIRSHTGDRSLLRALHFLQENQRVTAEVEALGKNNFTRFLDLVTESGNSSFKFLQSCYSPKNLNHQSIPLALALTEIFIKNIGGKGACRVHGGGFAGTIQVFLPHKQVKAYQQFLSPFLGKDAIWELQIRSMGSSCLSSK